MSELIYASEIKFSFGCHCIRFQWWNKSLPFVSISGVSSMKTKLNLGQVGKNPLSSCVLSVRRKV